MELLKISKPESWIKKVRCTLNGLFLDYKSNYPYKHTRPITIRKRIYITYGWLKYYIAFIFIRRFKEKEKDLTGPAYSQVRDMKEQVKRIKKIHSAKNVKAYVSRKNKTRIISPAEKQLNLIK